MVFVLIVIDLAVNIYKSRISIFVISRPENFVGANMDGEVSVGLASIVVLHTVAISSFVEACFGELLVHSQMEEIARK